MRVLCDNNSYPSSSGRGCGRRVRRPGADGRRGGVGALRIGLREALGESPRSWGSFVSPDALKALERGGGGRHGVECAGRGQAMDAMDAAAEAATSFDGGAWAAENEGAWTDATATAASEVPPNLATEDTEAWFNSGMARWN